MRYYIMIPLVFFLSYHQTLAQQKTSVFLLLGGGVTSERGNVSPIIGTEYTKRPKFGYSFGVGVTHSFGEHFSIDGRLLWELKGWKGKTNYDTIIYDSNWNPTYKYLYAIERDVSASYHTLSLIPKYTYKQFSVGIGAFVGVPYSSETHLTYYDFPKYLIPPGGYLTKQYTSLFDFIKFDWGLIFTISYAVTLKTFLFNFELVNNFGLYNVFQPNHGLPNFPVPPDSPQLHTNTYLFMVGVGHKKINRKFFHNQTQ